MIPTRWAYFINYRSLAVFLAAFFGWQFSVGAGFAGSNQAIGPELMLAKTQAVQMLLPKARDTGVVRVIVELNIPSPPGVVPEDAQEASKRREMIEEIQVRLRSQLTSPRSEMVRQFEHFPLALMRLDPVDLNSLATNPLVRSIQEDVAVPPLLVDSIPLIGADGAWAAGFSGSGQVVAVLDTGVEASHEFLTGKVVGEACFSSDAPLFASSSLCPDGSENQEGAGAGANCDLVIDGCDHGTHVAGIAVGDGPGMSGVAKDAQLISVQIFSRFDSDAYCGTGMSPCILTWTSDQIRGLEWIYTQLGVHQIASVNMSLGGGAYMANCDSDARKLPIDQLRSVDIATVIASGNGGSINSISSPACISSAVSVGSTTKSDEISSFSNISSFVSLLAPGSSIYSSVPGNGYATFSGTSMAAPHVAGAWAVLKSKAPQASVEELLNALTNTGLSIDDTRSRRGITGLARIQVDAALAALIAPTPTATEFPSSTPSATSTPITATSTPTPTSTSAATFTPTMASSPTPDSTLLLTDNFDRPNSNIIGNAWEEVETSNAQVAISSNQLCFVDTSDVINRPLVQHVFEQISAGELAWSFDFDWQMAIRERSYIVLMQLGSGALMSEADQNAGIAVNLIWSRIAGVQEMIGYREGGLETALSFASGPTRISVVANLDSDTYSVDLDGAEVGSQVPFDNPVAIDTIRFMTSELNDANFTGRCFDNLVVERPDMAITPTPTGTPVPAFTNTPTPTAPPSTSTPTATPIITQTPTPGELSGMHIGDLDGGSRGSPDWRARVAFTVHDANHDPVDRATVSGNWSDGYTGFGSCRTGSTGMCNIVSGIISGQATAVKFTVNNIVHSILSYQASGNHDPDGDSDGTSILILK